MLKISFHFSGTENAVFPPFCIPVKRTFFKAPDMAASTGNHARREASAFAAAVYGSTRPGGKRHERTRRFRAGAHEHESRELRVYEMECAARCYRLFEQFGIQGRQLHYRYG